MSVMHNRKSKMINNQIFTDIPCYYCEEDTGVKQIYNLQTGDPEYGWFGCLNCLRHLYIKPEIEKRYA